MVNNTFIRIHQRNAINTHKNFELLDEIVIIKCTKLSVSSKYKKEVKDKLNLKSKLFN